MDVLRQHLKGYIAGKRAAGRHHLNGSPGRADWDRSGDLGFRFDGKCGSGAIEGDAGRACQIGSQDINGPS